MSDENENTPVDETAGFVVVTSDMPQAEPQEEPKPEESTPSDEKPTVGAENEDKASGDHDAAPSTPKEGGMQKKMNKLVKQREDARRKSEALERENTELKAGKAEPKPKDDAPKEADFETYDEYLDAVDKHEKPSEKKAVEDKPTEPEAGGLTDSQKTAMAVVKEAIDGADVPDDFEKVALADDVNITGEMLEALAECDDPAKVMMHLGQNKELATEISGKSPAQQMREIAKLDLAVDSKPPKPIENSDAPVPITPVNGNDATEKSKSDMSFSEYEASRKSEIKARGPSW